MTNLSEDKLSVLTRMLEDRARELREDLRREARDKADYNTLAPEVPDPGDASFAYMAVDLAHAEATRDVIELRAIEAAYGRIENGTYGECTHCGAEIPFERLQAQPIAERCIPCQEIHEKTYADGMRRTSM